MGGTVGIEGTAGADGSDETGATEAAAGLGEAVRGTVGRPLGRDGRRRLSESRISTTSSVPAPSGVTGDLATVTSSEAADEKNEPRCPAISSARSESLPASSRVTRHSASSRPVGSSSRSPSRPNCRWATVRATSPVAQANFLAWATVRDVRRADGSARKSPRALDTSASAASRAVTASAMASESAAPIGPDPAVQRWSTARPSPALAAEQHNVANSRRLPFRSAMAAPVASPGLMIMSTSSAW